MFKHILIPTDGSPASVKAVRAGIALARESGARVTGYYAQEPIPVALYGQGWSPDRSTLAEIHRRNRAAARKHVSAIARQARGAGVTFEPLIQTKARAYEGIVEAAEKRGCDLILMASHGRHGLARLALGSVTDKVIQRARIPVMVYR